MRRSLRVILAFTCLAGTAAVDAQQRGLDPARLRRPLSDAWPTFSGDYTGRRYSELKDISRSNVKNLGLAWTARLPSGPEIGPTIVPAFAPRPARTIVGGIGDNDFVGTTTVKGSILVVDDVLYVTAPDNVWALDAVDGHTLWRYLSLIHI